MGCDIHMYREAKNNRGEWYDCSLYKRNLLADEYPDDPDEPSFLVYEPFCRRNYTLFSILADVRNYSDIEPICEPKVCLKM